METEAKVKDVIEVDDSKETSATPATNTPRSGFITREVVPLSQQETQERSQRYLVEDFRQKNPMKVCISVSSRHCNEITNCFIEGRYDEQI